jgi:uncharacterized membrane protein YbhN (UPF0104 family)
MVKASVTAVALAVLAARIDARELGSVFRTARGLPLVAAFSLYMAGQALSALRWWLVAREAGFNDDRNGLLRYYAIGMFFNLFGPGTLGGDAVRAHYLSGGSGRWIAAAYTVLFERLCGLVTLAVLLLLALAGFGRQGLPGGIVAAATGMSCLIVAAWWVGPLLVRWSYPTIEPALEALWRNHRILLPAALLSLAVHVGQVLAVWLVLKACRLEAPLSYCFVIHPIVAMLAAAPVSLAGLGVREASYVYFLARLPEVSGHAATAFALLWLALLLASSLIGGAVFLISARPEPVLSGLRSG